MTLWCILHTHKNILKKIDGLVVAERWKNNKVLLYARDVLKNHIVAFLIHCFITIHLETMYALRIYYETKPKKISKKVKTFIFPQVEVKTTLGKE